MKFKPGDIISSRESKKVIYLVLEVNPDKEVYKIFVLNHPYKNYIGEKIKLHWSLVEDCVTLQDKVFKSK